MAESMDVLRTSLADNGRNAEAFPVSNLYAWHVKTDRAAAYREARAKLFVRGMLEQWYISPFLDEDECMQVENNFMAFAQAYLRNSADIEGVPDALADKLVDNLTWTGDESDVDRFVAEICEFKKAGLTELAIRLYDEPEDSIRLIAERVMPALL
jgi:hypothetical protein